MNFDNFMVTPAIYQDIPSSYGMTPMPMCGYPMCGYPTYGISGLKQVPANDKFEKIQAKDKETGSSMKKAGIAVAILATAGWLFALKKGKIKTPAFLKNTGTHIKNGWNAVKNFAVNSFNKVANLFKKNTP